MYEMVYMIKATGTIRSQRRGIISPGVPELPANFLHFSNPDIHILPAACLVTMRGKHNVSTGFEQGPGRRAYFQRHITRCKTGVRGGQFTVDVDFNILIVVNVELKIRKLV